MDYPKLEELNSSNCTERSILKHYPEFWKHIIDNYHHSELWTERLYWFYYKLDDFPKCKKCGKPTKFVNIKTGYREFCSTKCMNSYGDIQERNRQKVLFIQGKGKDSKDDYIKIIPEVEIAINEYLQTRKELKKSDPLFVGTSNRALNQRITETSLSRLFKTIFKESGFNSSRLTAHSLRHSSNTLLFNSGADIYKVQKHARHSQIQTTERYIHSFNREQDTSEQDIFNQIYNKQSKIDDVIKKLNELSSEELEEVKKYLENNCK